MLTLILWFFAITGITFSVLYLEKKHRSPLLIQLLAAAFAAMFSIPVFRHFGDSSVLYVHIFNGLAAVLLALFISTLGLAWKRGSRDAPFLLLAFMPLMIVVALRLIISERGLLLDNGFQIGTVFEMLILAYGLTERVRRIRENGLRAMAENAAKSDYLANMAHELRAPLNAIIGFADVMKAGPLDKEQTEYIDYIHSSGDHLLTLINDLLDLSKIEAGRLELNEAQVDISKQLVRCLPFVKEVAALGDIQIESECPNDLPSIIADERMLRQMVINLLTNAVKFTPGGGRVTLSARRNQAGDLCIAVADTGYGMASEDIPVALRPYGQTAWGRHMPGSTGLGLPLVKRMAELHGGSIWIDSKLDVGTTVTIRLPAARFEDAGGATV